MHLLLCRGLLTALIVQLLFISSQQVVLARNTIQKTLENKYYSPSVIERRHLFLDDEGDLSPTITEGNQADERQINYVGDYDSRSAFQTSTKDQESQADKSISERGEKLPSVKKNLGIVLNESDDYERAPSNEGGQRSSNSRNDLDDYAAPSSRATAVRSASRATTSKRGKNYLSVARPLSVANSKKPNNNHSSNTTAETTTKKPPLPRVPLHPIKLIPKRRIRTKTLSRNDNKYLPIKDDDEMLAVVKTKSGGFKARRIDMSTMFKIMEENGFKSKQGSNKETTIQVSTNNSYVFPAGHYYFPNPVRVVGFSSP